jgi:hypothetical protein
VRVARGVSSISTAISLVSHPCPSERQARIDWFVSSRSGGPVTAMGIVTRNRVASSSNTDAASPASLVRGYGGYGVRQLPPDPREQRPTIGTLLNKKGVAWHAAENLEEVALTPYFQRLGDQRRREAAAVCIALLAGFGGLKSKPDLREPDEDGIFSSVEEYMIERRNIREPRPNVRNESVERATF